MNEIMNYNLKPNTLSEAVVSTLGTIIEIVRKAITTMFNGFLFLKLPEGLGQRSRREISPDGQRDIINK